MRNVVLQYKLFSSQILPKINKNCLNESEFHTTMTVS